MIARPEFRVLRALGALGGSVLFAGAILVILCGGQVLAWAIGGGQ